MQLVWNDVLRKKEWILDIVDTYFSAMQNQNAGKSSTQFQEIAAELNNVGFKVLGEKNGYTESHQTVVNVLDYGDGGTIEADLEKANIIVNRQLIPGDLKANRHYMHPGGIRLGTSEITRLGMKESEMKEIASMIKDVVIDRHGDLKLVLGGSIGYRRVRGGQGSMKFEYLGFTIVE